MKIALGLYSHKLNRDHYRFAKQVGATHIVANIVDYYAGTTRLPQADKGGAPLGVTSKDKPIWSYDMLSRLKREINDVGLELACIENLDAAHWYDALLGGPDQQKCLENVKQIIRNMGKAGIPVLGYNFSITGVWGHRHGPWSRGEAESVAFLGDEVADTPMKKGHVWGMEYDPDAPDEPTDPISADELWDNFRIFLEAVVPVAEEAGVTLSAHPDDPPMSTMRGQPKLVYQPRFLDKVLNLVPSERNKITACIGTISEMSESNALEVIEKYASQKQFAYVHCRNVRGKVPKYYEVFLDEGDTDILEALRILRRHNFDGMLMPGHTPRMTVDNTWHVGMAWQIGWIRASVAAVESENT